MTLGDGEYVVRADVDDGVRVWLDQEVIFQNWPSPSTHGPVANKAGRHTIKVEYFQVTGPYVLDVELHPSQDALAKRRANAGVALLRLNQPEKVGPLLAHSPDPSTRSYLIHRLGPLGADAAALVRQLDGETDPAIRSAAAEPGRIRREGLHARRTQITLAEVAGDVPDGDGSRASMRPRNGSCKRGRRGRG